MPRNYFRENRIRIQNAILHFDFLKPLSASETSHSIVEDKNKIGSGLLREVIIDDIPTEEEPRPKSWILNLEIENPPLFSRPQKVKTVEKALIVLGSDELLIFLLEMKSSLQAHGKDGVEGIRTKMMHSIGRISLLLPIYLLGDDHYNDIKISYKGIIFYNKDASIYSTIASDEDFKNSDFAKAFIAKKDKVFLDDSLNGNHEVELYFFQNPNLPNNPESFSINYEDFFFEEWEYQSSTYGDKTCPIIKPI